MEQNDSARTGRLLLFWQQIWEAEALAPPDGAALLARYAEPARTYHNLEHLEEVLDWTRQAPVPEPHGVALALFYHDAIYDPRREDNEEASAALAQTELRRAGYTGIATVVELILATRHLTERPVLDPLQEWMVDIDLSILGAEPERFRRYHEDVRREYHWVPAPLYAAARRKVLQSFLSRPRIYATSYFHDRLEEAARRNLQGVL